MSTKTQTEQAGDRTAVLKAFDKNSENFQGYENSRKYTAFHSDVCVELYGTPYPHAAQQDKAEDKIKAVVEEGELEVFRTHPSGTKAIRRTEEEGE